MEKLGIKTDVITCEPTLARARAARSLARPPGIRRVRKTPLSLFRYNIALRTLARRGDVKAARELLREMERDVAAPNVQTYTTLVSACATARDGPGALATVREMAARGVEPNEVTFRTALDACVGGAARARPRAAPARRDGRRPARGAPPPRRGAAPSPDDDRLSKTFFDVLALAKEARFTSRDLGTFQIGRFRAIVARQRDDFAEAELGMLGEFALLGASVAPRSADADDGEFDLG